MGKVTRVELPEKFEHEHRTCGSCGGPFQAYVTPLEDFPERLRPKIAALRAEERLLPPKCPRCQVADGEGIIVDSDEPRGA